MEFRASDIVDPLDREGRMMERLLDVKAEANCIILMLFPRIALLVMVQRSNRRKPLGCDDRR